MYVVDSRIVKLEDRVRELHIWVKSLLAAVIVLAAAVVAIGIFK